jgi:hypothetical protein
MQLQRLCEFSTDVSIKKALKKLPPKLEELYEQIYGVLSTTPDELAATVFRNVLNWLLCAQRTLHTDEFLAIVSVDPRERAANSISRDLVLEVCNNFVVLDTQLDTFRFAHLSVREFLERRSDYDKSTTDSLIAEICLWSVLSQSRDLATEKLFLQLGLCAEATLARREELRAYADIYWPVHCKAAGEKGKTSKLKELLKLLLTNGDDNSQLVLWSDRLRTFWNAYIDRTFEMQLEDTILSGGTTLSIGLFIACAFDFGEQIKDVLNEEVQTIPCMNRNGRSYLHVAAAHGSCATLACLLGQQGAAFEVTVEVVKAAAANEDSGKEVMALLLDRRGGDVTITEEVVKAAAGN